MLKTVKIKEEDIRRILTIKGDIQSGTAGPVYFHDAISKIIDNYLSGGGEK